LSGKHFIHTYRGGGAFVPRGDYQFETDKLKDFSKEVGERQGTQKVTIPPRTTAGLSLFQGRMLYGTSRMGYGLVLPLQSSKRGTSPATAGKTLLPLLGERNYLCNGGSPRVRCIKCLISSSYRSLEFRLCEEEKELRCRTESQEKAFAHYMKGPGRGNFILRRVGRSGNSVDLNTLHFN